MNRRRRPATTNCSSSLPGRDVLSDVTVLVVDDHKPTLDLLTSVLEHSGATVLAALKGTEAYTLLRRFKPDVFVSDMRTDASDRTHCLWPQRRSAESAAKRLSSVIGRSTRRTRLRVAGECAPPFSLPMRVPLRVATQLRL